MQKTKIIAEIGNNHNGNFKKALVGIINSKKAGADFVKFQFITPEKLVTKKLKSLIKSKEKYQIQRLKKICLPLDQIKKLFLFSRKIKIGFGVSVFDTESIKKLEKYTDFFKVASSDINFYPMLKELSKSKKKVIISSGMSNIDEILFLKKIFKKKKITVLHCISSYPTKDYDLNLLSLKFLKDKTDFEIGYSDHSKGILSCEMAATLGASVIEKHILIKKSDKKVGDFPVSISPDKFKLMVSNIRKIEKILGKYEKKCFKVEEKNRKKIRRSIYSTKKILKNQKIDKNNTICLRPFNSDGLTLKDFYIFNNYSTKTIPKDTLIKNNHVKKK